MTRRNSLGPPIWPMWASEPPCYILLPGLRSHSGLLLSSRLQSRLQIYTTMADRPVLNQHPLFRCPECRKGGFKSLKALCAHFESLQHVPLCQTCSGISFDNARSYLRHFHKDDGLKCQTKFCITYYQTQRSGAPQRPPAKEGVKRPKNTKGNQQVTISTNVQKTSIPQRNNPQSPKRDLVQTPTSKEINSLISSTSNLSVGSAPVCTKGMTLFIFFSETLFSPGSIIKRQN